MLVYHYSPDTGAYLNIATDADPDPMEPGRFLIPANATEKVPPFTATGQWALFRDDDWVVEKKPEPPVIGKNITLAPESGLYWNVSIKRALKGGL
jgi:hypothetical protein